MSLAGNAAALASLALLLAGGGILSASRMPAHPPVAVAVSDTVTEPAPVLLVVVDALRADTAGDAALMPELARLAARGARGTLESELLVPATLGAIVAMVEGRVVPPLAVLRDFGTTAATRGGVLERLAARGGRSFVAGTALWDDLYGRWIDAGLAVAGFPDAAADRRIEAAARAALVAGAHDLVVAHLGNLDRVGHRHGGTSDAYATAAGLADAAIGRLVAVAGADVRVLVTSDHGMTADGGHAGPERAARELPLVLAGPALSSGALGSRVQSALPALLDEALGSAATPSAADAIEHGAASVAAASVGAPTGTRRSSPLGTLVRHVVWAFAVGLATSVVLAAVAGTHPLARTAFFLSAALWASLAASALAGLPFGAWIAGAALALAALASCRRTARPTAARPIAAAAGARRVIAGAVAVGAGVATLRLADADGASAGWASTGSAAMVSLLGIGVLAASVAGRGGAPRARLALASPGARGELLARRERALVALAERLRRPIVAASASVALAAWLGGPALALAAALAVAAGWWLRRGRDAAAVGIALAVLPAALARLAGETVSLSSVDVAAAHHLLDGPAGLGGAVAVAVLREALPALALVAGWVARGEERAGDGAARSLVPVAFAATHLGAGLVFFAAFVGGDPAGGVAVALGLGGLLHTLADVCWIALGVGLAALRRPGRPPASARSAAGRSPALPSDRPSGWSST